MTLVPDNPRALAAIQALYEQLPSIECKGLCWNSCGPIDMSDAERSHIAELGVEIPVFTSERSARWALDEPLHCTALDAFGRCTVYERRPLICRMWGVTESMPCVYGCQPTGGLMPDVDAMMLLQKSLNLGGSSRTGDTEKLRKLMTHPVCGPLMGRFLRGDKTVEDELLAAIEEANL